VSITDQEAVKFAEDWLSQAGIPAPLPPDKFHWMTSGGRDDRHWSKTETSWPEWKATVVSYKYPNPQGPMVYGTISFNRNAMGTDANGFIYVIRSEFDSIGQDIANWLHQHGQSF